MADQSRLEIVIDSRGAEATARGVRRELEGMERAGNTATRAARSTAGGFGRIARQSQLAVPPVGQLTRLLGGLSGIIGARQVINYADAWQNAGNQLRQVTDSAEELAGTQERLMQVANSTRADFGSTANLYSRLARSTTELNLSQDDLLGLTRTINQSFATSGATATEAAAAITQLSQGLAAGALRGDEFNSVSEQAPGIMRAIAESLDMTIGELRDFAAEGGVTAEIVVRALQDSADAIENDFGRAVATFGQNMTVARNNLIQFVGDSDTVEEGVANIGESIVDLSENLEGVGQAATVVAGIFAGRLAGRFVTVAAGMTTAAGAATALRGALAFLGGPVGILVGAGGLLFAFREELGLVPDAAGDAREEIELLTGSLDDLNGASIDAAMIAINAQMFELERQARDTKEALDALDTSGAGALGLPAGATGEQARLQGQLGQIGAEQGALAGRREELLASREGLAAVGEAGDEAAGSLDKAGEGAVRLTDTAIQAAIAVAEYGGANDSASDAVDGFASSAERASQRLEAVARQSDPRFDITAGGDTVEARARARFEASAFRPGDASVINYAPAGGFGDTVQGSVGSSGPSDAAPKPRGSVHVTVTGKDGSTTSGEVEGEDAFIKQLAGALSGAASAS